MPRRGTSSATSHTGKSPKCFCSLQECLQCPPRRQAGQVQALRQISWLPGAILLARRLATGAPDGLIYDGPTYSGKMFYDSMTFSDTTFTAAALALHS